MNGATGKEGKTHQLQLLLPLLQCQVLRHAGILPGETDYFGAVKVVRETGVEVARELLRIRVSTGAE
jgi:hypothetical protein